MASHGSRRSLILILLGVVFTATELQAGAERRLTEQELDNKIGTDNRIVGGTPTTIENFPWQLYVIIYKDLGSSSCGGSIISEAWSMSAAHCFTDTRDGGFTITAEQIYLYAGVTDRSKIHSDPAVQINVFNKDFFKFFLFIEKEYNRGAHFDNDIAIFKNVEPWTFTDKVAPVALATEEDFIVGKELTASGWGRTCTNCGKPSILRFVSGLNLISQDDCTDFWHSSQITDHMICHNTTNRRACRGDSGGAVITGHGNSNGPPFVQIGIVSFGAASCEDNVPQVLTDVAHYRHWIGSKMRECLHVSDWPEGKYGMPMTNSGCPSCGSEWFRGYRYHDDQDFRNNNQVSSPNHFTSGMDGGRNTKQRICMKTYSESRRFGWPPGQYCIFKSPDQSCSSMGFSTGYIYWDDENSRNANSAAGGLPDGRYDSNTLIYYCCRDDGKHDSPIWLPRYLPFYLFPSAGSSGNCQKVLNMNSRLEFYRWDTEDWRNKDRTWGSIPYSVTNEGTWIKLYYCYYWSKI